MTHICRDCERDAIVGWGDPPVWYCLDHYRERLVEVREVIDPHTGVALVITIDVESRERTDE